MMEGGTCPFRNPGMSRQFLVFLDEGVRLTGDFLGGDLYRDLSLGALFCFSCAHGFLFNAREQEDPRQAGKRAGPDLQPLSVKTPQDHRQTSEDTKVSMPARQK